MHNVSFTTENGKIQANCVLCEKQFERDPSQYFKENPKIYNAKDIVWLGCICDECLKKTQAEKAKEIKQILIDGHTEIKDILNVKNIATRLCDTFNIPRSFLESNARPRYPHV